MLNQRALFRYDNWPDNIRVLSGFYKPDVAHDPLCVCQSFKLRS